MECAVYAISHPSSTAAKCSLAAVATAGARVKDLLYKNYKIEIKNKIFFFYYHNSIGATVKANR